MKEICDRWAADSRLETLRWGCHFIVIPIVSPYGFDNNTRKNENGVDPERNYPSQWTSAISDPSHNEYRGPAPLSEPACMYVEQVIRSNTDAIYYCSFHNMQSSDLFVWNASATAFGAVLNHRLCARLTQKWKHGYELPFQPSANEYVGYSTNGAPPGSSAVHATQYGIQGGSFEISRVCEFIGDTELWGAQVATLGTEAFVNWLLLNLEYGSVLKNSAVRIPG